jgi:hypothetical protein
MLFFFSMVFFIFFNQCSNYGVAALDVQHKVAELLSNFDAQRRQLHNHSAWLSILGLLQGFATPKHLFVLPCLLPAGLSGSLLCLFLWLCHMCMSHGLA